MNSSINTLQERINHARRTSSPSPEFTFCEFSELIEARDSESIFLIYIDDNGNRMALTYRAFNQYVREMVEFYKDQGLKKGDRISTISQNHWHTVVHYFAAWYAGLVVVPVNIGEDDARIGYIFEKASVKLALVRHHLTDRIVEIAKKNDGSIKIVVCDSAPNPAGKVLGFFGKVSKEDQIPDVAQNENDSSDQDLSQSDALIVFTSGTTGNPKGVVLTQRNLFEDARAISEWHNIQPETRMMCVLPIHHVNGTVVTLITPYFSGGSVVLNEKFKVGQFFPVIHREKVHIVSVVPTLLQFLNNEYTDKQLPGYPSLKHIICGAGPLTVTVAQNFEERFGVRIIHGYGLSETTCYSCYLPTDLSDEAHASWMRDYGYPSIGVALDVNEMDIQDEWGRAAGDEVRGEIVVRGYNVMREYYGTVEANEAAFTHGWFRSGDEGFTVRDAGGRRFYFITGRLKELIIRGGVNLAPLEIDEVLCRIPGVKAGIAVGFENDWYGEEVGAYVQMEEGVEADAEAVLGFCRGELPFAKCPKVVVFGDQIPVTSTGKYQRMKVAHLFKEWKSVQFREKGKSSGK